MKKSIVIAVVFACAVLVIICVTWLFPRTKTAPHEATIEDNHQENVDAMHVVSLEDIAHLPENPTYDDVEKLFNAKGLGAYLSADNLMYRCPAKEGGVYYFCFFLTRELALPKEKGNLDKLMLAAIIQYPSDDMFFKAEGGKYVYPARVAGMKFSSLLPFDQWPSETTENSSSNENKSPK
jgi:hypothetical protein